MPINMRTTVNVYCDGGVHRGLEFTVSGERPLTAAREYVRRVGWTLTRDGKVLCPEHANR